MLHFYERIVFAAVIICRIRIAWLEIKRRMFCRKFAALVHLPNVCPKGETKPQRPPEYAENMAILRRVYGFFAADLQTKIKIGVKLP